MNVLLIFQYFNIVLLKYWCNYFGHIFVV